MEAFPARARVRRRLYSAVPGFLAFTILGLIGPQNHWEQPWLFVGLGMALSATFVEPHFSTPRAAVVNSAAAITAAATADHGGIAGLWIALIVFLSLIFLAGATAATTPDGRFNSACRQLASQFGHAVPVGAAVLFLIVLTDAELGREGFTELAIGSAVLVASLSFDWVNLWSWVTGGQEDAIAIAAIGPRMLLLAGASGAFREGDPLTIEGPQEEPVSGSVVARMPHAEGLRYRVALSQEWTSICHGFPARLVVKEDAAPQPLQMVGAVGGGTTQRTLSFEPFQDVNVGDPLLLQPESRNLLYQVARLRLDDSAWSGASAVIPHAIAHLVGSPRNNRIESVSYLPSPHEPIYRGDALGGRLDAEYYEIGSIKGTSIPVGIRTDEDRRGHIAILGMSGMGKTGVAQRICSTLGGNDVVLALDTTGEYASRLGFPSWTEGDFNSAGHFVHEPQGDPPLKARELIRDAMLAGANEYTAGNDPTRRVLMLEEAHTFLPEWNVALRPQQDEVAQSTRMIMQARKFGITFVLVSQRTAVVSKSALSQCENYIILKTLDQTGLEYLESLVGPEMRDAIPTLERFEAMCVGPAFNSDEPVIVTLSPP